MADAFILSAARTPIGKYLGALSEVPAPQLGAVAVAEAHQLHIKVNAHARSAESVKRCVRAGVDNIYHASFTDEEGMDLLEEAKDRVFVAPGINWLIATVNDAGTLIRTEPDNARNKRKHKPLFGG